MTTPETWEAIVESRTQATWDDPQVVRNSWMATVALVVGGLVTEWMGLRFIGLFLLLLAAPTALLFVWRSLRLESGAAIRNNVLGLVLAVLAAGYGVLSRVA